MLSASADFKVFAWNVVLGFYIPTRSYPSMPPAVENAIDDSEAVTPARTQTRSEVKLFAFGLSVFVFDIVFAVLLFLANFAVIAALQFLAINLFKVLEVSRIIVLALVAILGALNLLLFAVFVLRKTHRVIQSL